MSNSVVRWLALQITTLWSRLRAPARVLDLPAAEPRRTNRPAATWTLDEVLGDLQAEHDRWSAKLFPGIGAIVEPHVLAAIRRAGPFILSRDAPLIAYDEQNEDHWPYREFPSEFPPFLCLGFRSVAQDDQRTGDLLSVSAIALVRVPRDHPRVARHRGITYAMYVSGADQRHEHWLSGVYTLDPERRTVTPTPYRQRLTHWLPNGAAYITHAFRTAPPLVHRSDINHGRAGDLALLAGAFRAWAMRAEFAQVATRRAKSRVTFGVRPEEIVGFFRDRDQYVMARDGKRKRIVHYVQAHTRSNGQRVRAHLRGVRRFPWQGYAVSISFPTLLSEHLRTERFDTAPTMQGDMSLATMLARFADAEDFSEYRHGRGHRMTRRRARLLSTEVCTE